MGYLNLVGSFIYKEPLFRSKLQALANNDAQLNTDGWAQSTKTLFFQATVPTGWTQDSSQNDKALRIVSSIGGGGSGGSQVLSTTLTLAHTHTIAADDAHTHAYASHTHGFTGAGAGSENNPTVDYGDNGGYFYGFSPGGSNMSTLLAVMSSPGAITLGSLAAHDHGGTDSRLTNMVIAYCDVIVGTKNAPGGTYTDLTAYWITGSKIDFDPFITLANNDAYNNGNLMPAGTVSIFAQASAPTGWTRIAAVDDRMLRVVSGVGGGLGGSTPLSSGLVLAHPHALTATADHTHSIPNHQHLVNQTVTLTGTALSFSTWAYIQDDGAGNLIQTSQPASGVPNAARTVYKTQTTVSGSGNTSTGSGHAHTIPSALQDVHFAYIDVIECSKDSGGAPYSYTDLTVFVAWKNLVSYQRLNNLAKNDAYIQYHTTPTGTGMVFFMASPPTGWSKILSAEGSGLRLVSGPSGGSPGGGLHLISDVITLAHTHVIAAGGGHDHAVNHTHPLDTGTQFVCAPTTIPVDGRGLSLTVASGSSGGGNTGYARLVTTSGNPTEVPVADPDHAHGAVTGSALTDVTLAYIDVLWCSKL